MVPGFRHERLTELYALARDDLKTYWPDKLEKTDRNFNRTPMAIRHYLPRCRISCHPVLRESIGAGD
jgi:hypothetical protein